MVDVGSVMVDFGSVFFRTMWCFQELRIDEKNKNALFNVSTMDLAKTKKKSMRYIHGSRHNNKRNEREGKRHVPSDHHQHTKPSLRPWRTSQAFPT